MIKIIKGIYGRVVNGSVEPMTKGSEPFKLSKAREAELVAAGVAEYVDEPEKAPTKKKAAKEPEAGNPSGEA